MEKAAQEVKPFRRFTCSPGASVYPISARRFSCAPGWSWTRLRRLCATAQGGAPNPTFAGPRLFNNPSREFSPGARCVTGMVEINQPGPQFLTTSPLRADERIVSFIKA
jgi:hypothetical protein